MYMFCCIKAMADNKTSTLLSDVSINGDMIEKEKIIIDAKVSGDIKAENNSYYLRYESNCRQIIASGLGGDNETETNTKLEDNGFI